MKIQSKLKVGLLCAASIAAISSVARAQTDSAPGIELVTVTGSRVITDVANSPTPITSVSTDQLGVVSPIDIPDALNALPIFLGSTTPTDTGNAANGARGNSLNLRDFGAIRTLVLFDDHRQPVSSSAGSVDIDTLPQTLVQRVDVVTGGASAVYGSDAITGVVNFVLNKNFSGLRVNANAGISSYGDGAEQQLSLAAGTDLFGGNGHFEGSFKYSHQDQILLNARNYGPATSWVVEGLGTAASPYINYEYGTQASFAYGGKITCTGCAANNEQFVGNGVIGPFTLGAPTAAANITAGGDGTTNEAAALETGGAQYQDFERFSYNLNSDTTFYIQAIAAQANTIGYHVIDYVQTGTSANQVFTTNPFLTAAEQTALANPSGKFTDTQYFQFPTYPADIATNLNRNLGLSAGLDGTIFGKYDWDLFASKSQDRDKVSDPGDESNAKILAAMDAVTNSAGQIVCQVSTTTFASLYPGCVPLNRFGPTAMTQTMLNYFIVDSYSTTILDQWDVSGSLSGTVFDLPAGPLKAALSGEYRVNGYTVEASPDGIPGFVDCTGLRLCVTGIAQTQHGISLAQPAVSENVFEFAAETDIPLLKDMPLVQSFSANLAGRYTDYSVSGPVQTWKIGLDYHVDDNVHFRATTSVDIRAPTLSNLYAPSTISHIGFADIHTGNGTNQVTVQSQGNPNLVPEVGRTYTGGVVLTPTFIPGLTVSVDAYQIVIKNAIASINGSTPGVQQACEASGGTATICALFVRPLPYSNTTPANYPSEILSETINAALNDTSGIDVEMDYGFQMQDVLDALPGSSGFWGNTPGSVSWRTFGDYQPNNNSITFPGSIKTVLPEPHGRVTNIVDYTLDTWSFGVTDRFYSKFNRSTEPGTIIFQIPYGKSLNYIDLNVDKKLQTADSAMHVYLNVQNLLNKPPPIEPNGSTVPGGSPYGAHPDTGVGTLGGVDNIGRYFTIGVRADL